MNNSRDELKSWLTVLITKLLRRIAVVVLLWLPFSSGFAEESKDEELSLKQMLLIPGDLTQAHANIESQCQKCHEHFDQSNQTPLCLDCHKSVQQDINEKKNFHGSMTNHETDNCNSCHSDHLGRDADIVGLDKDNYNHDHTAFHLKGRHSNLDCSSCHNAEHRSGKKKFTDFKIEKFECVDCHKDVHKGKLGDDCTQCHSEKGWLQSDFEHDKTDFPLLGQHKNLACSSCHLNQQYKDTQTECISCHLSKDKHFGVMGKKCQNCHEEQKWSKTKFNHHKDTEFDLLGHHKKIACESCHRKDLPLKLPQQCIDCHKDDDVHRGANGNECKQCHGSISWGETEFDHNQDTQFDLVGAHKKISCESCHSSGLMGKTNVKGRDCVDCHKANDPHQGNLGKECESCHRQQSWKKDTVYDHDFSQFPLTGAHSNLLCENCHFDADFKRVEKDCENCHKGNDVHKGSLGKSCANCHNTVAWITWKFDHNTQTKFLLEGAHQRLSCELCHSEEIADPLHPEQRCNSCHQQDDIHHGDFGPECQQCHGTEVFDDVR